MKNQSKHDNNQIDGSTAKCFEHLQPEEQAFLNDKKTRLSYSAGENIFKQGAFAPHVIYISEGLVKVYLQVGYDKFINVRLANAGEFIAFSTIFYENVYNYSAVAIKDTTICMIDKQALKQLIIQNPEFAMRITSKNCSNEGVLLEKIKDISCKQMRGKLASTLLYLSSEEFLKQDVFDYLNRQEIADFASISTESTIKFLKEFEKEEIIRLEGKKIEVLCKKRLEDISRHG